MGIDIVKKKKVRIIVETKAIIDEREQCPQRDPGFSSQDLRKMP